MLLFRLIVLGILTLAAPVPVSAEDAENSLLLYAVSINQTPAEGRSGTGIYLGKGLVLTASHVVGEALINRPHVTIAGQDLPARVVKQDTFERSDLALLAIDEGSLPQTLQLLRISLCQTPPWPGEDVITVIPEEAVHSRVMSPVWLPLSARRFSTVISDVARTGNSGSGVFDAQKRCLLGIMSRKISQTRTRKDTGSRETFDIAKYFVPASRIAEFMPADLQFIAAEPQPSGKLRTSRPAQ
jgi:S1-C subfamily serine protease